jgi:hypothetical protein
MAKKVKVQMLSPKKRGKGPPHTHMMEGAQERDMPSGMLAGRQYRKVKKH